MRCKHFFMPVALILGNIFCIGGNISAGEKVEGKLNLEDEDLKDEKQALVTGCFTKQAIFSSEVKTLEKGPLAIITNQGLFDAFVIRILMNIVQTSGQTNTFEIINLKELSFAIESNWKDPKVQAFLLEEAKQHQVAEYVIAQQGIDQHKGFAEMIKRATKETVATLEYSFGASNLMQIGFSHSKIYSKVESIIKASLIAQMVQTLTKGRVAKVSLAENVESAKRFLEEQKNVCDITFKYFTINSNDLDRSKVSECIRKYPASLKDVKECLSEIFPTVKGTEISETTQSSLQISPQVKDVLLASEVVEAIQLPKDNLMLVKRERISYNAKKYLMNDVLKSTMQKTDTLTMRDVDSYLKHTFGISNKIFD